MKSKLMLVAVISIVATPYAFAGDDGGYLSLGGGAVSLSDSKIKGSGGVDARLEFESGHMLSVAGGYAFKDLRLEGEVFRTKNDLKSMYVTMTSPFGGSIKTTALFLNAYWDYMNSTNVIPYVGGGIGYAEVHLDNMTNDFYGVTVANGKDRAFAYQLKLGAAYKITRSASVFAGYRYVKVSDVTFTDLGDNTPVRHQGPEQQIVELGFRYDF